MGEHGEANRIFTGGAVLTMEEGLERAEAVAIGGGRIVAAGKEREVMEWRGRGTEVTVLGEQALLPGFVDGHGHIAKLASGLGQVDLSAPPVGAVTDIESLVEALRGWRGVGDWVLGRGYDPAFLVEGRHPTRHDLDRVSRERPVYIGHVSGHLAVANTVALGMAGVDTGTPDPPGGLIRREASGEPDGVLEESAMAFFTRGLIPAPTAEVERELLAEAQRIYLAAGITTAQEGAMFPAEQALLEAVAAEGGLKLDVVGYAFWAQARAMLEGREPGRYSGRFRLGGMKLMLDGSPQGKTAWLTEPYHVVPEGQAADYRGYAAMPDEQAVGLAEAAYRDGWQVIAHCNGDAAADQFLRVVERVGEPGDGRRPVMIHAQTVREDQLERMRELGVLPSFFASHVYYWGDYHRDSVLGPERARRISPLASARRMGLRFNLHNDSPVVPPDIMRLVWCAVERRTRSGEVLGEEQRIGVMEALRAVTLDAAYAHFEEGDKGSIAVGKVADLVVLEADPTRVGTGEIAGVGVVEVVKG